MTDSRLNLAIILLFATTLLLSIVSSPAWPQDSPRSLWDETSADMICGIASSDIRVFVAESAEAPEAVIVEKINAMRRRNGLTPLAYAGDDVQVVARAHSERMLERQFFAHRDDLGRTAGGRLSGSGVTWRLVGENLLEEEGADPTEVVAADAAQAWYESPDHRANILDAAYTETAVGIASRHGRTYLTQLFLAR